MLGELDFLMNGIVVVYEAADESNDDKSGELQNSFL